jgi:sucrose phosphorylase
MWDSVTAKIKTLYPEKDEQPIVAALKEVVQSFQKNDQHQAEEAYQIKADDTALITYANTFESNKKAEKPIQCLNTFIKDFQLSEAFKTVHLLPFYPWDTDRGFSVVDYYQVDSRYGDWEDIEALSEQVQLMFDFVANHASVDNPLIQGGLIAEHLPQDHPEYSQYQQYKDFVIVYDQDDKPSKSDLEKLARPRPNPVLTAYFVYQNKNGEIKACLGDRRSEEADIEDLFGTGYVWTTFSRGKNAEGREETRQVDLNFKNPQVLIETIKILLFYIKKQAQFIRLDAVGYLWKKLGSTSLHEKETHLLISLIQQLLKLAAPDVLTIAEVNEPQEKVLTYLGTRKREEADVVYQFTHFPLGVYGVLTGETKPYAKWLKTLKPFGNRQFITVLGSHDGLGLKPAHGFLDEQQIKKLTDILVEQHQALPNYGVLPGGKKLVYEICATPWNLINKANTEESVELQVKRYLLVVGLGIMHAGIPAFYINGVLGAENYRPEQGLDENRTINREVFKLEEVEKRINNSHMQQVIKQIKQLLITRSKQQLFASEQIEYQLLKGTNKNVLKVKTKDDNNNCLVCLYNFSSHQQQVDCNLKIEKNRTELKDVFSSQQKRVRNQRLKTTLSPYQFMWLKNV